MLLKDTIMDELMPYKSHRATKKKKKAEFLHD